MTPLPIPGGQTRTVPQDAEVPEKARRAEIMRQSSSTRVRAPGSTYTRSKGGRRADLNDQSVRILDLFCGAGGASAGYHRAFPDAEIVGVDVANQPRYPFTFVQADAMTYPLDGFTFVHASPPCQRYSVLAKRNGNAHEWPDLVAPVRLMLRASGVPYVIENVEGAPLIDPVMLCGTMFPGLRVLRHRLFEASFPLSAPAHPRHPLVFTHDKRKPHYGQLNQDTAFVQVTGGGNCTVANKRAAMGVPWMTGHEANEAIPPAYTEWVGRQCRMAAHLAGPLGVDSRGPR